MAHVLTKWMKVDRSERAKRIVKKYSTQLTKATMRKVSEGASLASSLYNKNYVHDRYFLEMIKTVNREEPELDMVYASTIISAIRRVIYCDPETFIPVVNILKRHESVGGIARKMESEYYDDERNIVKLMVFGSTGLGMVVVLLLVILSIMWYFTFASECFLMTPEVKEDILLVLNSSSGADRDLDFDDLSSHCRNVFELHSLTYELFQSSCNHTDLDKATCLAKHFLSEMESLNKDVCIESITPVFNCLEVQLNITELANRTRTENKKAEL